MRWGPLPGALGGATGAIAIGMAATSTSTTTIISIRTTILIATSVAKAATGNTIRNTVGTLLTATEEQQTSSVVRVPAELAVVVASGEPVVQGGLAELAERVVQVELAVWAALAVPGDLVELAALAERVVQVELAARVVQEALAELVVQVALAELVVQVALAVLVVPAVELELNRVVGLELALVVVPVRDPVAEELELVPVGAVPARGHPHDLLAVPLGTKSVTALHHHGLAPVPAVEDLAAVAETTREPVAVEEVAAWAAAE